MERGAARELVTVNSAASDGIRLEDLYEVFIWLDRFNLTRRHSCCDKSNRACDRAGRKIVGIVPISLRLIVVFTVVFIIVLRFYVRKTTKIIGFIFQDFC